MHETFLPALRAAFPEGHDHIIVRGMNQGILLADDLIKGTPLLGTPVGTDLRGHLRRAGIMFRLHDLCQKGELPFVPSYEHIQYGTWHHLELLSGTTRAHLCRSDGPELFPDDTPSRQEARLTNQLDLFSEPKIVDFRHALGMVTLQVWLTYGLTKAGELTHVCMGIPAAEQNEWLARVNILKSSMPNEKDTDAEESFVQDPEIKLKFKKEIQKELDKELHETDETNEP